MDMMFRKILYIFVILIGLVLGGWFLFQGLQQLSYAAYLSEVQKGDLAFKDGHYDEALSFYTKASESLFSDKALLHYKMSNVYYQKGETFFKELLENPTLIYSLVEAGANVASGYYDKALAELQQMDVQTIPEDLRWKSYYQLGNISFRKLLLLEEEADAQKVQADIERLFREALQHYKNALDARPLNLSREDKILEIYLIQNLEYLIRLFDRYQAEKNKIRPDIAQRVDIQARVDKLKLLMPALDLSPEVDKDRKGGKFGQGLDKGIK
jgi:tetratricopeptide (TPR) repeat protein